MYYTNSNHCHFLMIFCVCGFIWKLVIHLSKSTIHAAPYFILVVTSVIYIFFIRILTTCYTVIDPQMMLHYALDIIHYRALNTFCYFMAMMYSAARMNAKSIKAKVILLIMNNGYFFFFFQNVSKDFYIWCQKFIS